MALLPYILTDPSSPTPVIADVPHSGRIYPVDFAYACPLPLLRQAEDPYVDEVVAGAAEAGAALVVAEFPRSMIDANRAEDDIDPSAFEGAWETPSAPEPGTLRGFGLIRRLCLTGAPIYRAPLPASEGRRRIETYYRPYHECLRRLSADRMARFGFCCLLDIHSMPDRAPLGAPRADFILGDRDGKSCAPHITRTAKDILESLGYRVAVNDLYKGREIVRRHGREGGAAHALQIEINRRLYWEEAEGKKHAGFARLRGDMTVFFRRFIEAAGAP